ncbi:MAG: PHP domain-containing protein [Vicinamibacteraceae bacterium]
MVFRFQGRHAIFWVRRKDSDLLPALERLGLIATIRGDSREAAALDALTTRLLEMPIALRPGCQELAALATDGDQPRDRLVELCNAVTEHGADQTIAMELERLPADLVSLLRTPGFDFADLHRLARDLDATTFADFAGLCASMPPSADGLAERLAATLPTLERHRPRVPLGRATAVADTLHATFEHPTTHILACQPVGSLRRYGAMVGDITLLVAVPAPERWLARVTNQLATADVRHRGTRSATVMVQGEEVTLRAVPPEELGCALVWYTGSRSHVEQLGTRARARGLRLTPNALLDVEGRPRPCPTEAAVYEALGLPCIPHEIRHGDDEITRAERGELPRLITRSHICGDLHLHSLWSDGRDPIERMLRAAHRLGYEYVAITDHSQSAAASRVLSIDRLERQRDEIDGLRERFPDLGILHGAEVDILPNGRLDFPDRVLERLDIVLASLHDEAGQGAEKLTARYLGAIRHPLVNIITHPTNRLVGRRKGYDLDFDRIFDAAVQTRTALEIDGAPGHLDMDDTLARRAVAAAATVVINSDCHMADRLGRQMEFGVGMARRAGLGPAAVLNTRPLNELRAFIARKRNL